MDSFEFGSQERATAHATEPSNMSGHDRALQPGLPTRLHPKPGWRIVEYDARPDAWRTLFHATRSRSRTLYADVWYEADRKRVRDGSGNRWYESGFHVFERLDLAREYLYRFGDWRRLEIVGVWFLGERKKPSNPDVILADWMYIPSATSER